MRLADVVATVVNIRPLGVAIAMKDAQAVGTEWLLAIELPTGTCQVAGRVVHCAKAGAPQQWVVGFCFFDLSQHVARELRAFMK